MAKLTERAPLPIPTSSCGGAEHREICLASRVLILNLTVYVKEKAGRSESKPSHWIFICWEPLHYFNFKYSESFSTGLKGIGSSWGRGDA